MEKGKRLNINFEPVEPYKFSNKWYNSFSLPEFITNNPTHAQLCANKFQTPCAHIENLNILGFEDFGTKKYRIIYSLPKISTCVIGIVDYDTNNSLTLVSKPKYNDIDRDFYYESIIEKVIFILDGIEIEATNCRLWDTSMKFKRFTNISKELMNFSTTQIDSFITDKKERDKYKSVWVFSDSPFPLEYVRDIKVKIYYKEHITSIQRPYFLGVTLNDNLTKEIRELLTDEIIYCGITPEGKTLRMNNYNLEVYGKGEEYHTNEYHSTTFEGCTLMSDI